MSFAVAGDKYDRFMGRYSRELAPLLIEFAGVKPGMVVVDVGCGPGPLTERLVERVGAGNVAAADPSEPFVAATTERAPGVDVRLAAAEQRPWGDDRRILGVPDLSADPRFATPAARNEHRQDFEQLLEEALQHKTTAEWMELMEPEGLFAAPVKSFAEAFTDEQVAQQGMIATIESPVGELKLPAPPYRLSRTPAVVRTAPPRHGEHTDEVLESVGFSRDEIDRLRQKEAI